MKAFSRILGTIVLFFVAFFLIGVFIPSVSYDIEIEINRPPGAVFQALTDSELLPQWVSGLKSSKLISGKTENSGAIYSMIVEDGDQTVAFEETITRFEPDSILSYSLDSKSVRGSVSIKCMPESTNTRLQVSTKLVGNVWFSRSLLPLIKHSIFERNDSDYNNFKLLMETIE